MRPLWVRRAAVAAAAVAIAGCGAKYDLPTESQGRAIPPDGSYQMIATWTGKTGIRDLTLTQGSGSQLFALFNTGGSSGAARGAVFEIARSSGTQIGPSFGGLFNPIALTSGSESGPANRIFVLDQGDTCMARQNPANGGCDSTGGWGNRLTHIEFYWKLVEYDLLGNRKSAFTDTALAYVNGVAADDQGNVFIAGVAIIHLPTTDPRLTERVFEHRVWRYRRGLRPDGNADPTVVDPVTGVANGAWHRDEDYELRQGTGVGAVIEARGMQWQPFNGPALFVADLGNFRIEKVRDGNAALPIDSYYHTLDIPDAPRLMEPLDVCADPTGFFYVADATGAQVLRFDDNTRTYVQRVDVEPDASGRALVRPVTVAADDIYAYVGDAATGQIIRYRRRT